MSFLSGRVSFTRFLVTGGPEAVNDKFLAVLKKHAFTPSPAPRVGTPEVGFNTGTHLLDSQFDHEKNVFGNCAHFAMRLDQHQVPGDVKKAHRMQNEQAAAKASGSGFASKADKADAKDAATRRIEEELASGKYRRSKLIPVLWDLETGVLYCGNASNTVVEELAKLLRESFGAKIQPLSSGYLAAEMLSKAGKGVKAFDDLRPTPFTAPPAGTTGDEDKPGNPLPGVPWIAKARDLRDFVGNEFLMWLLWKSQDEAITVAGSFNVGLSVSVTAWNCLDLECAWGVTGRTAIRMAGEDGSPLRASECKRAFASGKWARKAGMMLSNGENAFELVLQGDQFQVSAALLPEIEQADSDRELQDARVASILELDRTLQATFQAFLKQRLSSGWTETAKEISKALGGK